MVGYFLFYFILFFFFLVGGGGDFLFALDPQRFPATKFRFGAETEGINRTRP